VQPGDKVLIPQVRLCSRWDEGVSGSVVEGVRGVVLRAHGAVKWGCGTMGMRMEMQQGARWR
jgi:hypothetical protein